MALNNGDITKVVDAAALSELHATLTNTLTEMSLMGKDVQEIKTTQQMLAKAHSDIAEAAKSMAETFKRAEVRQTSLESTNQSLYKEKGISPNVFFLVTGTLCAVIILVFIWITDTSVKATLTSFEAGKKQAQALAEVKKDLMNEMKDGNSSK